MLSASAEVRVRYEETDKMGVVYHANYLTWFEVARVNLLDLIGCPYKSLEQEGFYLPVLSCKVDFLLPAHFDDKLEVVVKIEDFPGVRLRATYLVYRQKELLGKGETTHAFVSSAGKVVRPPSSFLDRTKQFAEESVDCKDLSA